MKDLVQQLKNDLKAEVIVASWMEERRDTKVVLQPKGLFARGFDRDIQNVHYDSQRADLKLDLNRESLYDSLPEGLFHKAGSGKPQPYKDPSLMVSESRRLSREEKDARKFFLAYEQEMYRQRVQLELVERRSLDGFVNPKFQEFFQEQLWDLPQGLPL